MNSSCMDVKFEYYLAQYQRPLSFLLAFDELVCPKSHSFAKAGHKKGIGNRQQGQVLAEIELVGV